MNTTSAPSQREPGTDHFLNRLALEYESDPRKLALLPVIADFFNYADLHEHMELFDQFCIASMQECYTWKSSCPANGIFYGERLELLIEVAYLLQVQRTWKPSKKKKHIKQRVGIEDFPMYLTGSEYLHPMNVVDGFFAHADLRKWKKMLSAFICNALSSSSVVVELPAEDLLPFAGYMRKLICAAHRITALTR